MTPLTPLIKAAEPSTSQCLIMKLLDSHVTRYVLEYCSAETLGSIASTCQKLKTDSEATAEVILRNFDRRRVDLYKEIAQNTITPNIYKLHQFTKKRVFLVGGGSLDEGADSYRRVDQLDCVTNKWSDCPLMSTRRGMFKTEALGVDNCIVVVSGDDDQSVGTLEAFDPITKSWMSVPDMPEKLMLIASASIDKKLYISGGIDKTTGVYSTEVFCLENLGRNGETWQRLRMPMPCPRVGHASAFFEGNLWVAGGQRDDDCSYSTEYLDLSTGKWAFGGNMLSQRMWLRLLVIGDALYAVGGDVDAKGTNIRPTIEKYNTRTKKWEFVASLTKLRRVFSITAVGSSIYVYGGRDNNFATLQDWDRYDLQTRKWDSELEEQQGVGNVSRSKCVESQRIVPRAKFYGGQAVTIPSQEIRW